MKQEFVETNNIEEAKAECLWASEIVEVEGGFMAFESVNDFEIWNNQL